MRESVANADAVAEMLFFVALSVPLALTVTVCVLVPLVEREVDALADAVVVSMVVTVRVCVAVADGVRLPDAEGDADTVRAQCSIGAAPTAASAAY